MDYDQLIVSGEYPELQECTVSVEECDDTHSCSVYRQVFFFINNSTEVSDSEHIATAIMVIVFKYAPKG